MHDLERQQWKSIIHKLSKEEHIFLWEIMDYLQTKAEYNNLYYQYELTEDVKEFIEENTMYDVREERRL